MSVLTCLNKNGRTDPYNRKDYLVKKLEHNTFSLDLQKNKVDKCMKEKLNKLLLKTDE